MASITSIQCLSSQLNSSPQGLTRAEESKSRPPSHAASPLVRWDRLFKTKVWCVFMITKLKSSVYILLYNVYTYQNITFWGLERPFKSSYCSSRGPEFGLQHPYQVVSITPAPGHPTSSSSLGEYGAAVYTHTHNLKSQFCAPQYVQFSSTNNT